MMGVAQLFEPFVELEEDMSPSEIIYVCVAGLYVICSVVSLIIAFVKKWKSASDAEKASIIQTTLETITKEAQTLIAEAETFTNYTGAEKLNYVITRLMKIEQNVYTTEQLTEIVNEQVALTNAVNTEKKSEG